jgi:hypothetical protein
MTLKYPSEVLQDFITIQASDYVSRRGQRIPETSPGNSIGNYVPGPPAGPAIILPLPDLPNMASQQKYGPMSGALNAVLAGGLSEAYNAISDAVTAGNADAVDVGGIAGRLAAQFSQQGGPVAKEVASAMAGAVVGVNGAQFQTLASGEITNPNIELLYSGPSLRSYSMSWTLAPKNQTEANNVYQIIRQMKRNHLPTKTSGMLRVPKVFKLTTHIQGKPSKTYQMYKPCVLEAFSVKQDATGQHMTLPDGSPVVTSISCVWKEINITTSEDFEYNL